MLMCFAMLYIQDQRSLQGLNENWVGLEALQGRLAEVLKFKGAHSHGIYRYSFCCVTVFRT